MRSAVLLVAVAPLVCACGPTVVSVGMDPYAASARQGSVAVRIRVRDRRTFGQLTNTPAAPQLSEDTRDDPEMTARFIGQLFDGRSREDLFLPKDETVLDFSTYVIRKALRDQGFVVLVENEQPDREAIPMVFDVTRFWVFGHPVKLDATTGEVLEELVLGSAFAVDKALFGIDGSSYRFDITVKVRSTVGSFVDGERILSRTRQEQRSSTDAEHVAPVVGEGLRDFAQALHQTMSREGLTPFEPPQAVAMPPRP